ncbi:MAG: RpiB/LacA/LacB family sugar-phosphate isomerase [Christensenellales bacterium]|jgi:ribose 5-phosphate isomerase B
MRIVVGGDRAGYSLKTAMIPLIESLGHQVVDIGCGPGEDLYFPIAAKKLCALILSGEAERGIMFCGTGVGASIACNKIPGIRASIVHDIQCAHQSVEHDHVQVMCIGEKCVGAWHAWDLIQAFLVAEGETNERVRLMIKMLGEMDGSGSVVPD